MILPYWIHNFKPHSSTRRMKGMGGNQGQYLFSRPLSSEGPCPGSYALSGVEHAAPPMGVFSWVCEERTNHHSSFVWSLGQPLSPLDYLR